jgi:sister-chromatid-cohesion protein PDS5
MPSRRSGTNVVPLVEEMDASGLVRLQFKESLSWKAGRSIALTELLRRLKDLRDELETIEQEECDKASFTHTAQELCSPNLLAHKDPGVRALSCCCVADILRLCAPDAPFTETQLKVGLRI